MNCGLQHSLLESGIHTNNPDNRRVSQRPELQPHGASAEQINVGSHAFPVVRLAHSEQHATVSHAAHAYRPRPCLVAELGSSAHKSYCMASSPVTPSSALTIHAHHLPHMRHHALYVSIDSGPVPQHWPSARVLVGMNGESLQDSSSVVAYP